MSRRAPRQFHLDSLARRNARLASRDDAHGLARPRIRDAQLLPARGLEGDVARPAVAPLGWAVGATFAPFAYCLFAMWLAGGAAGWLVSAGSTSIPWAAVACFIFALLCLPLLVHGDRKTEFTGRLRRWMAARRRRGAAAIDGRDDYGQEASE